MDELSILALIVNASWVVQLVILILIIMSVYSWTIALVKKKQFLSANNTIRNFDKRFYLDDNLESFYENLPKLKSAQDPSELIFSSGYSELQVEKDTNKQLSTERAYRAMNTVVSMQSDTLNKDLSVLAMIASSSPYIGLFGTVWGIMQSFLGLASIKQATIAVVAPGIAEALIATAFGLFAAIPATIFYNRLTTQVSLIIQKYINFTEELFVIFQR